MVNKSYGFSLIELMIVVVIIGVLLALAVPFASAWSQGSNVQRGNSLFKLAYQTGKALALRNPTGTTTTQAAGLKMQNGLLLVCQGDPSATSCNTTNAVWQGQIPKNTTVTISGTTNWTFPIDSRGLTSGAIQYTVTEGGVSETYTL